MAFLTVLLILGSLARIGVLIRRPSPAAHFCQPRRRLLATRMEQAGDIVVLATVLLMLVFGYGHHPPSTLLVFWTMALLAGFSAVLFAHAAARRHRPDGTTGTDGRGLHDAEPSESRRLR